MDTPPGQMIFDALTDVAAVVAWLCVIWVTVVVIFGAVPLALSAAIRYAIRKLRRDFSQGKI